MVISCASTGSSSKVKIEYDKKIEYDSENPLVNIDVYPKYTTGFLKGYEGFSVNLKNNTSKVVKIDWDNSSISYGYNNSSYPFFMVGQKYADAGKSVPATIISGNSSELKSVFSSGQVRYVSGRYGGWTMDKISFNSVKMTIHITSGDIEQYAIINITARQVANE